MPLADKKQRQHQDNIPWCVESMRGEITKSKKQGKEQKARDGSESRDLEDIVITFALAATTKRTYNKSNEKPCVRNMVLQHGDASSSKGPVIGRKRI